MSRYPAIGAHEDAVRHTGAAGVVGDDFVSFHGDDQHPLTNGQGIPHVSDTPWTPSYRDLPQCNGTAKTTGQRCKAKAAPGEEFCESHRE